MAFSDDRFAELFTQDTDVVFAFHGYPRAVHQLLHGRENPARFHVRGFTEQGTTTTPFDMVVLNRMSRYHLVLEALRRSRRAAETGPELARLCESMLGRHYTTSASISRTCRRSGLDLVRRMTSDGRRRPRAESRVVITESSGARPNTCAYPCTSSGWEPTRPRRPSRYQGGRRRRCRCRVTSARPSPRSGRIVGAERHRAAGRHASRGPRRSGSRSTDGHR